MMRTFSIYFLSNFQIYHTAVLITIIVLYIISQYLSVLKLEVGTFFPYATAGNSKYIFFSMRFCFKILYILCFLNCFTLSMFFFFFWACFILTEKKQQWNLHFLSTRFKKIKNILKGRRQTGSWDGEEWGRKCGSRAETGWVKRGVWVWNRKRCSLAGSCLSCLTLVLALCVWKKPQKSKLWKVLLCLSPRLPA